jgi:hypothetical protein
MNINKTFIFICGESWEILIKNGYKTRKGALLKHLINSKRFDQVILIVETGYKGNKSYNCFIEKNSGIQIIEIQIPNRFPSTFLQFYGVDLIFKNYVIDNTIKSIFKNIKQCDFIWSYSIYCGLFVREFKKSILIYDVIDYRKSDPTFNKFQQFIYSKEITHAIKMADIITYNSPAFLSDVNKKYYLKCYKMMNGVEKERFNNIQKISYRNKNVIFIGAISKWIDFKLIKKLLLENPKIKFDFYGFIWFGRDQLISLQKYSNFRWHGLLKPNRVPNLLKNYKVAIVPYEPKITWNTMGDSMKIYEYLASETPVISTNFQSGLTKRYEKLINICNTHEEFNDKLKEVLKNPVDKRWNLKVKKFIELNSWENRINSIIKIIDKNK